MTIPVLPADVARCAGREDCPLCMDCLRRLSPPGNPERQVWVGVPAFLRAEVWMCAYRMRALDSTSTD